MTARILKAAAAALICTWVASCTVSLVEDYDPVLDQGLSSYQADIAAFLAKMSVSADAPQGAYDTAETQAFYAYMGARLQALVDRAEALDDDGACLPANFVGKGIKRVVANSADLLEGYRDLPFDEIDTISGILDSFGAVEGGEDVRTGNCTVIMVKVVMVNQELLRLIHKDEGKLAPLVAGIAGETIAQAVRIAIKNEVLKKRRRSASFQ